MSNGKLSRDELRELPTREVVDRFMGDFRRRQRSQVAVAVAAERQRCAEMLRHVCRKGPEGFVEAAAHDLVTRWLLDFADRMERGE